MQSEEFDLGNTFIFFQIKDEGIMINKYFMSLQLCLLLLEWYLKHKISNNYPKYIYNGIAFK
jgi:hypothetical protein